MNTNIRDVIKDKSVKIRLRWKWLMAMGVLMGIVISQCSNGLEPVNMEDKPLDKPLDINTRPKVLAIGMGFSVGIKPDGTVWTWGTNDDGVLGRKIAKPEEGYEPGMVPELKDAVSVSASDCILVLMKDGTVWSWGRNDHRQLGYETSSNFSAEPRKIDDLTGIVDVSTLRGSSQALTKDGVVFGWGWNGGGRLGDAAFKDKNPIYKIQGLREIIRIQVGSGASFAIDGDGRLWSYGEDKQRIGRNTSSKEEQYIPAEVAFPNKVVEVSSDGHSVLVLLDDGTVWSWGYNNGGQLGTGERASVIRGLPQRIKYLSSIVTISGFLGGGAISASGSVVVWGVSAGSPAPEAPLSRHDLFSPHKIIFAPIMPVRQFVGGYAVVDASGDVFYWHGNTNGQRGTGVVVRDPDSKYWLTPEKSHWKYN